MKFIRISLLCALCMVLLACGKDSNPSDNNNDDDNNNNPKTSLLRFTLDGPGIANRTYDMNHTFYTANYLYEEEEQYSVGSLIGADMNLTTAFPGKSTGTYTLDGDSFVTLSIHTDGETQVSMFSETGSLTILEANAGTGRLKGTFSGTFMSTENRTYTVTNGSFTIQRK